MSGYNARKDPKGQSTIEYIIVVAIVIAVTLSLAGKNGVFQNALKATYDTDINFMLNMAERILE